MTTSTQVVDAAFKQRFADGMEDVTYRRRPLYGLWPKKTDLGGANLTTDGFKVPIKFANTNAISGNFAIAQAKSASVSSKVQAWIMTTAHQYGFIQLDMESVDRSEGGMNAFIDLKALEMEAIAENLATRLHHFSYLDGTGALAQVGNSTQMPSFAVSTMQLNNSETAVYFQPTDELTVSATESGAERAFGSGNHGWLVLGVNLDAGQFTVATPAGALVNLNDATDGIPAVAALDWIAHRGDRQVAGAAPPNAQVITGFAGFIPNAATTITSTTLYGLDRSQFVDFLAGSRQDYSGLGIEDALVRGANVIAKKDGMIEQYFVNHKHYSDLVTAVSSKGVVTYLNISPEEYPTIGYRGIRIQGANSEIDVIADYACPSTQCTGMDVSKWKLASVGDTIKMMVGDGLNFLRSPTSDSIQAYWVSYAALFPESPRDCINLTMAA
jgi:hypothetical protein